MNSKTLFCMLGLTGCLLIQVGCDRSGDVASNDPVPEAPVIEAPAPDPAPVPSSQPSPVSTAGDAASETNNATQPGNPLVIKTEIIQAPAISPLDELQINLLKACKVGNLMQIRTLLEQGASANIGDNKFKNSPIMHAAGANNIPCMELLLEYGADINHTNSSSATALMWAAMKGNGETVQYLINHGADPNMATPSGKTALSLANARAEDNYKSMIIVLLEQALSTD